MTEAQWLVVSLPFAILGLATVLYPLVLMLAGLRRPDQPSDGAPPTGIISVVITSQNQGHELRGAIESLLAQVGLSHTLQVIVASDGSKDRTERIAHEYVDRGVVLFRQPVRTGRTAVENKVRAMVSGDIVCFLDVAARPSADCLALMVEAFRDPGVGVVSSRDLVLGGRLAAGLEGLYAAFETWLGALESRAGGMVNASGSFYAIRARLYVPLATQVTRDFATALLAQHVGLRSVSVPGICGVRPVHGLRRQRRSRSTTTIEGMATLLHYGDWLQPFRQPGFVLKVLLHKVARWLLVPTALAGLLAFIIAAAPFPAARLAMSGAAIGLASAFVIERRVAGRRELAGGWLSSMLANVAGVAHGWAQVLRW